MAGTQRPTADSPGVQAAVKHHPPPGPGTARPVRWAVLAATLGLLLVLASLMIYPQLFQMDRLPDMGDPLLNTWALSWIAHQVPLAPARLFHANIFYPEPLTLLYSESLLAPGLMAAPLAWLGVPAVVNYNIVFLAGFVLSGAGVALLVLELTEDVAAAVVAAVAFAFLPFRMDHYSHLQLQQTQFIPLALWALHRVVRRPTLADGMRLGLFAGLQLLSCVYLAVFLMPYLAVVALVLLAGQLRLVGDAVDFRVSINRAYARRAAVALAAGGAVCLLLVAPVGRAYIRASQIVGERSADEARANSATIGNYLAAPRNSVTYGRWAERFGGEERRLFPGLVVVALSLLGLRRRPSTEYVAHGVALVVALDLSLGFNGILLPLLWHIVMPFRGLRVPARMGVLVGFALCVLSGYGVRALNARVKTPRRRYLLVAGLVLLVLFEYRVTPYGLKTVPMEAPPIYAEMLADIGDAPRASVLELPATAAGPTYMYYSTFHWQNLLNGYSGFFPPSFRSLEEKLAHFPDGASLEAIRRHRARYVLIHGEIYDDAQYAALVAEADRSQDLVLLGRRPHEGKEISLYRVRYDAVP